MAAALALPAPATAANESLFSDPRDDGDPDVADVLVSNSNGGNLTVVVAVANMPELARDAEFLIGFDTDRNAASGGEGGAEYAVQVLGRQFAYVLRRWDGSSFVDVEESGLFVLYRGGLRIFLDYIDLGRPAGFDLFVRATRAGRVDRGPDAGAWRYEVAIRTELDAIDARFAPKAPAAGAEFVLRKVRVHVATGEWVKPGRIRCRAVLGGREIATTCRFRIPENAAGRKLVVWLTATYRGDRARFVPYVFRVRG